MKRKKLCYLGMTVVLWLGLWQAVAMWIDNRIFLPRPAEVVQSLLGLLGTKEFYGSIGASMVHILQGFLLGIGAGTVLAVLAATSDFLQTFLSLPMRIIKATPVASFTILALFWVDSSGLSVLISFCMVLPVIYTNVVTGIRETDKRMLEMAEVFRMNRRNRVGYIYVPAVLPYLFSAVSVAIGLAWKSGIAAEVIGITKNSIGNRLYQAKIYMEMPEVFAWTAVTVVISIVTEVLVLKLLRALENRMHGEETVQSQWQEQQVNQKETAETTEPADTQTVHPAETAEPLIVAEHIAKAYGEKIVLQDISLALAPGKPIALLGSSGIGKTTLLRVLLGLEVPDEGCVVHKDTQGISVVFQENRLCETLSVERNLRMVCKTKKQKEEIPVLLQQLGLAHTKKQRVSALSGGMKRRAAIARALLKEASVVLLDEPFQGLDNATKQEVMALVKERTKAKAVFLITHDETEAEYFDCETMVLFEKSVKNRDEGFHQEKSVLY